MDTQKLEHASFLENLGSQFRLDRDGSEQLQLELVEVSERKTARLQEMFSIVFRCGSNEVLPQRIYRLEHDNLGQLDLFIVPIQKDDQGVRYEAVFNRLFSDSESSESTL
jgi:hypothetical protein